MHYSAESGSWTIKNRVPINESSVSSCFVLPNASILVAMLEEFSFFSIGLEHIQNVKPSNIVDGLMYVLKFKSLS